MNAGTILDYLSMISNRNTALNLNMHLMVMVAVLSIFTFQNSRIKKHIANSSILVLFLSVVINAWVYGNPFHLITFLILIGFTGIEMLKGSNTFNSPEMSINTIVSIFFIGVGLWYPEFVNVNKLQLLLFSPVGIVPCPTLLVSIGLLGLTYPQVNKLQYSATITMGMIFGIIGTFVLKVYLDITLLIIVVYSLFNLYRLKSTKKVSLSAS